MNHNPYRVGSWVVGTDFYNRYELLQDVLTGPNRSLWIIGNRRIGKTSLLRMAEQKAANSEQYLPLFWDMQGDNSEAQLIESLLEAIENAQWSEIDKRWQAIKLPEGASRINEALRNLAACARKYRCRLLLLCDEIEGFNQLGEKEPHVLSQLRRAMQHNPSIRTILTSTRRLSRLYDIQQQQDASLFLEGFEPRYLAHFDDDTANQVICRRQCPNPLTVKQIQLVKIRSFSGNHPLILQKICGQLYNPESNTLDPFEASAFFLDEQLSATFQHDFDSLTPDEANVLLAIKSQALQIEKIERAFQDISAHSLRRILHDLTKLGFLRQIDGAYQASSIPLGRWLAAGPTHNSPQGGVTNRMIREVTQERVTGLYRELLTRHRALAHLREQAAKYGNALPTHIQLDIDDHISAIASIETELTELGETITPSQPPRTG